MQKTVQKKVKYVPRYNDSVLSKINLSENQYKVIADKYMKDAPSVEAWLMNVAENIALAEVLYEPSVSEKDIFKDTEFKAEETKISGKTTKTYFLHEAIVGYENQNNNFRSYINNLYDISRTNKKAAESVGKLRLKFYSMMANFEFLPNSPTLMNAGRSLQQLSACYVLPVGDSIEEIYDAVKFMALIHKSGGGTGFSFSKLRPAKDAVQTTSGISSGPVTFMTIFDKSTEVVKQGGTRRGANMGILRYDHPDVMRFINAKKTPGMLENFNISVAIDDKFMQAMKNNQDYDLINPRSGQACGKMNAKFVFDTLVKGAWETGDPGIIIIDRINNSDSNPTPQLGEIESTNPCGEQPLLPYEPCNLGSINLSKFVLSSKSDMDWERLKDCVHTAIHFLDNVIDVNNYPLPKIERMAKSNRRIGLGVMGWAEALVQLGLPYNSDEAIKKAEEVMKFINDESVKKSVEIAEKRGVFPNWEGSIFDPSSPHFRGNLWKIRHCARTTIAPTGTIGITAGLQGAGIEPFFAIVYVRYNAAALDAIKSGKQPDLKDCFFEVNPSFKDLAKKHNFFGLKEADLWMKIEKNHKSLIGIKEIPVSIQKLFLTSHDIETLEHVRMQAAFQKHTNNAVSKTINMRNDATIKDVEDAYLKAYEWGLKGITVYRDGSKSFQVLNISEKKESKDEKKDEKKAKKKTEQFGEMSTYYEIDTGYGPLHMHINYDKDGPTKMFTNISPVGTEISGLTAAIGILLSKYLEYGGDPSKVIKHLNSIKGDRPVGFGPKRVDSIPHAISKALRDHLIKTGKFMDSNGQTILEANSSVQATLAKKEEKDDRNLHNSLYCPKCFSSNVTMLSGCSGPTCYDCGHSECS